MRVKFFLGTFIIMIAYSCSKIKYEYVTQNTKHSTKIFNSKDLIQDTYISDYYPYTNYSEDNKIYLCDWTFNSGATPSDIFILLKFDYSQLPQNAKINSAKLSLYSDTTFEYGFRGHTYEVDSDLTISILQIVSDWDYQSVCYDTRPVVNSTPRIEVPIENGISKDYHLENIDVSSLVRRQLANKNYGFYIKFKFDEEYKALIFTSSESPNPNMRPKLELDYSYETDTTIVCEN